MTAWIQTLNHSHTRGRCTLNYRAHMLDSRTVDTCHDKDRPRTRLNRQRPSHTLILPSQHAKRKGRDHDPDTRHGSRRDPRQIRH